VPNPVTAAMIPSEIPAANSPYSGETAPDSFARNSLIVFIVSNKHPNRVNKINLAASAAGKPETKH